MMLWRTCGPAAFKGPLCLCRASSLLKNLPVFQD
jgi:hypothetical protein